MEGEVVEIGSEITKTTLRYTVFLKIELFQRTYENAEKEIEKLRKTLLGKRVLIHNIEEEVKLDE